MRVDEFYRNGLFVEPVVALTFPHGAHATGADAVRNAEWTNARRRRCVVGLAAARYVGRQSLGGAGKPRLERRHAHAHGIALAAQQAFTEAHMAGPAGEPLE